MAGRHRRGEVPLSSLPVPVPQHTHLEAPRHPPLICVPSPHSPQPLQPQRHTAQRPASVTQRSPADSGARGRAVPPPQSRGSSPAPLGSAAVAAAAAVAPGGAVRARDPGAA